MNPVGGTLATTSDDMPTEKLRRSVPQRTGRVKDPRPVSHHPHEIRALLGVSLTHHSPFAIRAARIAFHRHKIGEPCATSSSTAV